MKLASVSVPVEVSGGSAASSFSIAMNGKAFRVLSDTLYQNKIGSIVREVSCNAYDAHVMAGHPDLPFVIHIPDAFEPWFSVQDFGVGLSPNDIANVFTVYFQSTKDNSNDAVGAFGLGAKTPFSYTDQFTVTSVQNGMKHIYSAFITESGVPSIVEMTAMDTTDANGDREPNGVEIKLSVKREDYSKFRSEVAAQLKFFKVKPQITNDRNFEFVVVNNNLAVETVNVAISNDAPSYGQQFAHIIQGNVGYPLDLAQLQGKISDVNQTFLNNLSGSQVRLFFNIGEIGVTASREGVEYNKNTVANIDAKLTVARAELTDFIGKTIAAHGTDWEKAKFINSSSVIKRLARASDISIPNVKCATNGSYYFDFEKLMEHPTTKNSYGHAIQIGCTKIWAPSKTVRETTLPRIEPGSTNYIVVLRDTANRPNIRAKHYLSTLGPYHRLLEIDLYDSTDYTDQFIADLSKALGGYDQIKRLSDVELPVREVDATGKKVRTNYTRPTHYSWTPNCDDGIRSWVREFEPLIDAEDTTVYIPIKDMEAVDAADNSYLKKYDAMRAFNDKLAPLVAIRENDVKKIATNELYVKLGEYIETEIAKIKSDGKTYIKWRHQQLRQRVGSIPSHMLLEDKILVALQKGAPNSKVTKYLSKCAKFKKTNDDNLEAIARFMGWMITHDVCEKHRLKASKFHASLLERFPLIKVYPDWQVRAAITPEHLAKYVSVM